MEFKDAAGEDLKPGDDIKYYSSSKKEWRPARVKCFIWDREGWQIKVFVKETHQHVALRDFGPKVRKV